MRTGGRYIADKDGNAKKIEIDPKGDHNQPGLKYDAEAAKKFNEAKAKQGREVPNGELPPEKKPDDASAPAAKGSAT